MKKKENKEIGRKYIRKSDDELLEVVVGRKINIAFKEF